MHAAVFFKPLVCHLDARFDYDSGRLLIHEIHASSQWDNVGQALVCKWVLGVVPVPWFQTKTKKGTMTCPDGHELKTSKRDRSHCGLVTDLPGPRS